MENKKLIKILLKDMAELEELISEVKNRGEFESLEIEFIHTRAKGILQLLNILDNKDFSGSPQIPYAGRDNISQADTSESKEYSESIQEETSINKNTVPGTDVREKEEQEQAGETMPVTETTVDPQIINGEVINEEDMLEDSEEISDVKSRLGDSFLKARSVNDMITEQNKLEFKLSNRPLASIKTAIGINDHFQYIRELFDNDARRFVEAVEILDSMKNEKEAAEYLRVNFKWKKNEASLKFINLVKRRFHHE